MYRAIDRDGNLVDSMLREKRNMDAASAFSSKLSTLSVMYPNESRPMDMTPTLVRSARRLELMSCSGPTHISTIDWSKTTEASNSATISCAGFGNFTSVSRICRAFDEVLVNDMKVEKKIERRKGFYSNLHVKKLT